MTAKIFSFEKKFQQYNHHVDYSKVDIGGMIIVKNKISSRYFSGFFCFIRFNTNDILLNK